MNKKIKNFNDDAIDITSFLTKYYGIKSSDLNKDKITHQNLTTLFPYLIRVGVDWTLKNQELVYTGQIVFVRDCNNCCVPYQVPSQRENNDVVLDDREFLICELVSAINKINRNSESSFIIVENRDDIKSYIIGNADKNISVNSEEILNINNNGGILIKNTTSISTFQYLIKDMSDLTIIDYSQNKINAINLSRVKDFISIIISDNKVSIVFEGKIYENLTMLEIRNFLLKMYNPRKKELQKNSYQLDISCLRDYEIERLVKKYYKEKNYDMYFKLKKELKRRHKNNKTKLKRKNY